MAMLKVEMLTKFDVLGVVLEWKLTREDTGNQYCVLEATVPPGIGIPPHQHPDQEAFFVTAGTAEFALEGKAGLEWRTASAGEMVNIPGDALHGFRNTGKQHVRVLITCPARLGKFFEDAAAPLQEPSTEPTTAEMERVLDIARRHGQRFAIPA